MVARKVKTMARTPVKTDAAAGGGSKFRRKLSHGLSFISNPLSQRKTGLGRQSSSLESLAANATAGGIDASSRHTSGTHLPPVRDSAFFNLPSNSPATPVSPDDDGSSHYMVDSQATPKALPRSRTASFIPRPAGSASYGPSEGDRVTPKPHSPPTFHLNVANKARPSKIPSPPRGEDCRSSPRQYNHQHNPTQAKHTAAGMPFTCAEMKDKSPSKDTVRSRTTPNLVKVANSPQRHFVMSRNSGVPFTSSGSWQISQKENTPTGKHNGRNLSGIRNQASKRLSMRNNTTSRCSLGLNTLGQSKTATRNIATAATAANQLSSNLSAAIPLAAEQAQQSDDPLAPASTSHRWNNSAMIVQPRLMGPKNPPTPPMFGTSIPSTLQPSLPRASTDRNLKRQTFGASSIMNDGRISSRSQIGANQEVRTLRWSTFHNLHSAYETHPSVPPIPEEYSSPANRPYAPGTHLPHPAVSVARVSKLPAKVVRMSTAQSEPCFMSTKGPDPKMDRFPLDELDFNTDDNMDVKDGESLVPDSLSRPSESTSSEDAELGKNMTLIMRNALANPGDYERPWSIDMVWYADTDDCDLSQITEYMPPLWWAGRFQSRLDQWRTDAMQAELDPKVKPAGLLGQCKLNEDKTAVSYIFQQLRDLCGSEQAADSLWEFEYKYHVEHRLLEAVANVAPIRTRVDVGVTTPKQTSFGRAVRKLTPRKASLVNLFKGKAWNKIDETKTSSPYALR